VLVRNISTRYHLFVLDTRIDNVTSVSCRSMPFVHRWSPPVYKFSLHRQVNRQRFITCHHWFMLINSAISFVVIWLISKLLSSCY
jgi:hypothetical protein